MKKILILLLVSLSWISCQNNPDSKTVDAANGQGGPQAGTLQGISPEAASKMEGAPEVSNTELVGMKKSVINGSNVTMRKDASIQSEKIGSFDANEEVEALESKNVQNEGEGILGKAITVKGTGGVVNLNKGKAVVIEGYLAEKNLYRVTYEDPKKGKLSADIDASAVETVIYATWFKVKRKNGEEGWVLGKFLKYN